MIICNFLSFFIQFFLKFLSHIMLEMDCKQALLKWQETSRFHDRTRLEVIRSRLEMIRQDWKWLGQWGKWLEQTGYKGGGAKFGNNRLGGLVKYQTCLIFCWPTTTRQETTTDPYRLCKHSPDPKKVFSYWQVSPSGTPVLSLILTMQT